MKGLFSAGTTRPGDRAGPGPARRHARPGTAVLEQPGDFQRTTGGDSHQHRRAIITVKKLLTMVSVKVELTYGDKHSNRRTDRTQIRDPEGRARPKRNRCGSPDQRRQLDRH